MEERGRMVRAVSEDTERPYFHIRYKLSLSGRDLFSEALNSDTNAMDISPDFAAFPPASAKRRSKSVHMKMGGSSNALPFSSAQGLQQPSRRRNKVMKVDKQQNSFDNMKRTRSVGALEMKVNRFGSPKMDLQTISENENREMGLITCLNSKNIKKYAIGQSYRKGVIVAIDEEQNKIVVYHQNMPAGPLALIATESARKYERGYPVEDEYRRVLGLVHAIDRVQNVLIVNTQAAEAAWEHPEPFHNESRRLSEVAPSFQVR